jgi:hypothetical protein
MVVYIPLTTQNVAKYRTWMLSATVSRSLKSKKYGHEKIVESREQTYRYPIPPREQPIHINIPLLCNLSDAYAKENSRIAATAYGGTVSS